MRGHKLNALPFESVTKFIRVIGLLSAPVCRFSGQLINGFINERLIHGDWQRHETFPKEYSGPPPPPELRALALFGFPDF